MCILWRGSWAVFSEGADGCTLRVSAPLQEGEELMREFEDGERNDGGLVREEKIGGVTRREFLELGVAATLAAGAGEMAWAADTKSEVPRRTLGRTGEKVSVVGLGGYHIGSQKDEQESIRIIRTALDSGINFLDNCWDYNNGESEVRMGKALRDGYRQRAFVMTKIDGRTKEAAVEAQKAGKVRYIGFTGHKSPDIHFKMLETADAHKFHFDSVQMPLNVMDAHYNSFGKKVLPVLVKKEIGVLGRKPMGAGIILRSKTVEPVECFHYAMSLPTSVVITGCDSVTLVEQAVDAAKSFKPLSETQVATLLAKTKAAAQNGEVEGYKTTTNFDGTAHNPQWLG